MTADFRSDTVTRPDEGMLNAMMTAELGDDVFGEDPTVNALQAHLAQLFGHEAALFCPSGTMTNQIAIAVHTRPGDEVICDRLAHIYNYEGGGIARNSGASVRLVHGDRGCFTIDDLTHEINPPDCYYARTSLIAVEDTCNKGGGSVYRPDVLEQLSAFARLNKLKFHLDGARVFNALAVTGLDPKPYGQLFDSISVCLSKGLGAPAGSVLIGSNDFIAEALRVRKVMGGGMRQAGVLAAAGLYALSHRVEGLKNDHRKAQQLAETLEKCTFIERVFPTETNIVIAQLNPAIPSNVLVEQLEDKHILCFAFGHDKVRFVTHADLTDLQVDQTCAILKTLKISAS